MKKIPVGRWRECLVDDEDFEELSRYKWHWCGGYASRTEKIDGKVKHFAMHRMLMGYPEGMTVDHINGRELDNRKDNLRICTRTQNNWNRPKPLNNTSGYKGVDRYGSKPLWRARICVNGEIIEVTGLTSREDAHEVRKSLEREHYGEFTRQ